ncbi:MAG: hypothetical protein QM488_12665 [Rhizobiaceae bacterium]
MEDLSLHSNQEEVADQIEDLSVADQARLIKIARYYAPRTAMQAGDLLQEAYIRSIDGTRLCPPDVLMVIFLANVIRSIACGELDKRKRREVDGGLEIGHQNFDLFAERKADIAPSQEDLLIIMEGDDAFHAWLMQQFENDDEAILILLAMFEGMKGEQLCREVGCDADQLATIRRRIKRKIETLEKSSKS